MTYVRRTSNTTHAERVEAAQSALLGFTIITEEEVKLSDDFRMYVAFGNAVESARELLDTPENGTPDHSTVQKFKNAINILIRDMPNTEDVCRSLFEYLFDMLYHVFR